MVRNNLLKYIGLVLMVLATIGGCISCGSSAPSSNTALSKSQAASVPVPSVSIIPQVVPLTKTTEVVIMGFNFTHSKEVRILFTDLAGAKTDLGDKLDPNTVVSNGRGAWVVKWTKDSFNEIITGKLLQADVYGIEVTDADYKVLASVPVCFYDPAAARDKWPAWAQTAIPK